MRGHKNVLTRLENKECVPTTQIKILLISAADGCSPKHFFSVWKNVFTMQLSSWVAFWASVIFLCASKCDETKNIMYTYLSWWQSVFLSSILSFNINDYKYLLISPYIFRSDFKILKKRLILKVILLQNVALFSIFSFLIGFTGKLKIGLVPNVKKL